MQFNTKYMMRIHFIIIIIITTKKSEVLQRKMRAGSESAPKMLVKK